MHDDERLWVHALVLYERGLQFPATVPHAFADDLLWAEHDHAPVSRIILPCRPTERFGEHVAHRRTDVVRKRITRVAPSQLFSHRCSSPSIVGCSRAGWRAVSPYSGSRNGILYASASAFACRSHILTAQRSSRPPRLNPHLVYPQLVGNA